MNKIQKVKEELISKLFIKGVKLINREVALDEFKSQYFPDEERTLALYIEGMEHLPTGFVFEEGKVRPINKLRDKVTLKVFLSEDAFLAIACEEVTMSEAYWYGMIEVDGDNFMRDFHVFQKMFHKYPQIIEKINPKKGAHVS